MNPSQAAFAELRKDLDKARTLAKIQAQMIEVLTDERAAWQELREIREIIKANPEESTADEVRRAVSAMEGMAAQVEAMTEALGKAESVFEANGTHPIAIAQIQAALALPNTTADILRQRDARTLREAAEIMLGLDVEVAPEDWLLNRADELAPRTLRTTEESHG